MRRTSHGDSASPPPYKTDIDAAHAGANSRHSSPEQSSPREDAHPLPDTPRTRRTVPITGGTFTFALFGMILLSVALSIISFQVSANWQRSSWALEIKQHDEQLAQMENERNKHKPFWGPPRRASDRCLTYGTREYTAKLYNILTTETWADKCANTSIEIKGRTHARPIRCQDYGSDRGIYGYWLVNYDEPECKPIWDQFWKKGCDHLPGHRRWESILSNTYSNSDMPEVCRSTPGTLPSGEHFTTSTCIGSWRGWIGQWDVPDSSCAWE